MAALYYTSLLAFVAQALPPTQGNLEKLYMRRQDFTTFFDLMKRPVLEPAGDLLSCLI